MRAELVRDGEADAMVSAGNTGATMAAALLRMGRIRGVARPAIAVPIPVPGSHPQLLVDGGATVDCTRRMAACSSRCMGREYARIRLGVDEPPLGLLSNGEEAGKGDELRKARVPAARSDARASSATSRAATSCTPTVDVIVTDGFTGQRRAEDDRGRAPGASPASCSRCSSRRPRREAAGDGRCPLLLEAARDLDPDLIGGAVLLGVNGVCVISHGSSSRARDRQARSAWRPTASSAGVVGADERRRSTDAG